MSANFRCYDPVTGQTMFDLAGGISRIVGTIDGDSESGEIAIPSDMVGGANLFVIPSEHSKQFYTVHLWVHHNQQVWSGFDVQFVNNKIIYKKAKGVVLFYGFYV